MTIDEAIEILTTGSPDREHTPLGLWDNAIKLGIEALKRCQSNRSYTTTEAWILLPGETK